ncbi:MAG: UDP-N-acetylglucosamine 1-carboxyvinyltransferase [Bacteroidetes bacterium]|nr:UDP-N-acetylglucosamine 1-carboxyvinyltransferase [Bacteroidota bacterium]
MDKLVVRGGQPLIGDLHVSGSKNTALPLMAIGLLTDGPVTINHIPDLKDISTFRKVIEVTGTTVIGSPEEHRLVINAASLDRPEAPYELVKRMRASFYMLGALLGRTGQARVSLPGGCDWGPRPVDLHIEGMKSLGATVELDAGYVVARANGGRLSGGRVRFEPSSVGATINVLLGAVLAKGESVLENAAIEPDVVECCQMLRLMGAQIDGIGTRTLHVQGVDRLEPVTYTNCPDRIELGTFMIAAAISGVPGKPITIHHANPEHLGTAFLESFTRTGAGLIINGDKIQVTAPEELRPVSIRTDVYPGFPTDLQAQWTVLLAKAVGNSKVHETIYPDRFKHIPELHRMGVNAIVVGDEAVIEGGKRIQGTSVMSTDLRASVSLVLAGMIAEGETQVLRVYHLDRGYERVEEKLANAGIDIKRVRYDEWADPD